MYAIEKSSMIARYTYIPKEININQQDWLNSLKERVNWFEWFLVKAKKRLKINTMHSNTDADKDRKCAISPIIRCFLLRIIQGAYNFHHVLQKFLRLGICHLENNPASQRHYLP